RAYASRPRSGGMLGGHGTLAETRDARTIAGGRDGRLAMSVRRLSPPARASSTQPCAFPAPSRRTSSRCRCCSRASCSRSSRVARSSGSLVRTERGRSGLFRGCAGHEDSRKVINSIPGEGRGPVASPVFKPARVGDSDRGAPTTPENFGTWVDAFFSTDSKAFFVVGRALTFARGHERPEHGPGDVGTVPAIATPGSLAGRCARALPRGDCARGAARVVGRGATQDGVDPTESRPIATIARGGPAGP